MITIWALKTVFCTHPKSQHVFFVIMHWIVILSNRFFLFPKILFLIKSWKIKKANPERIFNIMIFVTTFVSYTYWNLARKPHLRQVILALVFVQFVYTFCTLFKPQEVALMDGFVGWSDGRSVCLQKISKTLKRRFREYKLMKLSQPSPVYDWGGKVISWNTQLPTYHQPTTHQPIVK